MPAGPDAPRSGGSPAECLIGCARAGDIARRQQAALRRIALGAPITAAVALAAAFVAPLVGGSRMSGVAVLVSGALVGLALLALARGPRELRDAVVQALDREAGLSGELRSGYWFARLSSESAADIFVAHHLEDAAARVSPLSWPAVYPAPSARRSWALAAALAIATLVAPLWAVAISRGGSAPASGRASADAVESSQAAELAPAVTAPELLDAFRAMKSGDVPSKRSLAAVERAMQAAEGDAAMQAQLQGLFDRVSDGGDDDLDTEEWAMMSTERREAMLRNREAERASQATMARLEWAVQEARARAAATTSQDDPSAGRKSRDDAVGAEDQDSRRQPSPTSGAVDNPAGARQVVDQSNASVDPGRGTGYRSHSSDHDPAAQAAAAAATAHLAEALRREVIEAGADQAGASVHAAGATRRATNSGTSTGADGAADASHPYAAASTAGRARTPDARQRLIRDYFVRTSPASPGVP